MQIKGTAVKITPEYVKKKYPDQFNKWLDKLPDESKKIMTHPIIATDYYDLSNAVIIPTIKIGELFFNHNEKEAALELGRQSADIALTGVYKIFVMISTPAFMLSRATSIFSTYYRPSDIKIVESEKDFAVFEIRHITKEESLIAWRIAGWMEHALHIVKRKDVKMDIKTDFTPGNEVVTITMKWE
ncbi:MAG: hypothetical protein JXB17_06105 [Bacteroidales bacterium]|nr:hypothetical protein [Bacteroidales bacterium]